MATQVKILSWSKINYKTKLLSGPYNWSNWLNLHHSWDYTWDQSESLVASNTQSWPKYKLFRHLICPVADHVWTFCEKLWSVCGGASSSLFFQILLPPTRKNGIARGTGFSSSQSILWVNPCWKDSKPLGTCRYAPKNLWGTCADRQYGQVVFYSQGDLGIKCSWSLVLSHLAFH